MSAMTPTLEGFGSQPSGPRVRRRRIHAPRWRRERPAPVSAEEREFDARILPSLRLSDEKAYAELLRANTGRMLAVARRLLLNEEDARDAVQQAFLLAFRALPQFAGRCCLSTWLYRIVVNESLMKLRHRRRHPEGWMEELLPEFHGAGLSPSTYVSGDEHADTKMERAELRQLVQCCINSLPERYRTVVILRDIEDLPAEEACGILQLSRSGLKTRLHRGRQALQKLLEAELSRRAQIS